MLKQPRNKYILVIDTDNKIFKFTAKLTDDEALELQQNGYNVLQSDDLYLLDTRFKTRFSILACLYLQDICRLKFNNPARPLIYAVLLKQAGLELTEEQKKLLDSVKVQTGYKLNNPKKIILFSASSNDVGKTTTAEMLVNRLQENDKLAYKLSFADGIRTLAGQVLDEFQFELNPFNDKELYNAHKNHDYLYDKDFNRINARNLVCDYSDLIQKHLGAHCWAKYMCNTIDSLNSEYVVIDDYRRPIEYDYLVEHYGKENILTVHLTKDGISFENLSEQAKTYEGQIKPESSDLVFNFNSDWSNTNELLDLIISKL